MSDEEECCCEQDTVYSWQEVVMYTINWVAVIVLCSLVISCGIEVGSFG